MSVEGTTPGPRAGAAASDDEAGEDEAGGGEAGAGGQSQQLSAPRGLGAEAAEAAARDMDVAEALEASAESAAGAGSRLRPAGRETWSRPQKRQRAAIQKRKQHK
jgi:hypothetical protein